MFGEMNESSPTHEIDKYIHIIHAEIKQFTIN